MNDIGKIRKQILDLMKERDELKNQLIEAKRAAMFDFGRKLEAEVKLGQALAALKKIAAAENCPLTGLGSNYKTLLALNVIKELEES